MKKTILLSCIFFFVGSLTLSGAKPYNTPFINSDETIFLQEGMSKDDVLAKVGNPLYVKSGVNNTIVWIYEVRLTKVQSDTNQRTKKQIYKKSNSNTIQSDPTHRLQVVFVDNEVQKWEMSGGVVKSNASPTPEKSSGSIFSKIKGFIPFIK